jgi:AcrR family transcriptional regulator
MLSQPDISPVTIKVRTEPVQKRGTERIKLLLDVAAQLIDEKGIDGLTTSDVAARSDSSVGVVYRYFPNIQTLLRALAARNMELFTERIFATMDEDETAWANALDKTIDHYVDLTRSEPGFRALRFGDVIDERFIQPDVSNNTLLAKTFTELLTRKYGIEPTDELTFDFEVLVEIGDALLHRAFLYERDGDERFIDKLREIVRYYMAKHDPNSNGQ